MMFFFKNIKNQNMSNKVFLKLYWTYFHVDNLNTFLFQNDKLEVAYEIILANKLILNNYKIIEIGCSNGALLYKINSSYTNYKLKLIGIDLNHSAIKSARLFAKKSMINNIDFYTKCNNFESNLIISISTIIYLDNNQLNDFRQSNKIFIISPASRNNTFVSSKNILRSKESIISIFHDYILTEFPLITNWDNDQIFSFCCIFEKNNSFAILKF